MTLRPRAKIANTFVKILNQDKRCPPSSSRALSSVRRAPVQYHQPQSRVFMLETVLGQHARATGHGNGTQDLRYASSESFRARSRMPRTHSQFAGPSSAPRRCPDPIVALTQNQLSTLDPTGARVKLFSKGNPEAAKVGDILLVKQKSGDPFAGVCIDIRRRGIDLAICLRNSLTRVGVEVWFKVHSPLVEGIEIVQRKEQRARRARLYYMRKPKHDIGSVANIVRRYQEDRLALLGSPSTKASDAKSSRRKSKNTKT